MKIKGEKENELGYGLWLAEIQIMFLTVLDKTSFTDNMVLRTVS